MGKSKITPMAITDIEKFIWNGEICYGHFITYRDKYYVRYSSHWVQLFSDGHRMKVDVTFQSHLNRAYDTHFGDKKITKESKIIIE